MPSSCRIAGKLLVWKLRSGGTSFVGEPGPDGGPPRAPGVLTSGSWPCGSVEPGADEVDIRCVSLSVPSDHGGWADWPVGARAVRRVAVRSGRGGWQRRLTGRFAGILGTTSVVDADRAARGRVSERP